MGKNYKILGIVFGSYLGVRENLFACLAKKHEVILPVLKLGRLYRYYSHLNSYTSKRPCGVHPNGGASVFAMPSIQENFRHVFLEAMAYKTPCIGTAVDAMPEIIENGKTGFLVPPNDHKELADKLILLLEEENLMKRMGEPGRRRVEKYFT